MVAQLALGMGAISTIGSMARVAGRDARRQAGRRLEPFLAQAASWL
jgi:hypothetical protein